MKLRRPPLWVLVALLFLIHSHNSASIAWDSRHWNPTTPTHSYLTNWGIDALKDSAPELDKYREALIDGANVELHELKTNDADVKVGVKYQVDLETKRVEHRGTNEGCGDIEGWWKDCLKAYQEGKKERAYFYLGVILHMVEDMGVPAHANKIVHQGNLTKFDNFEFMALSNWKPSFKDINKADPGYAEPWKYYDFSQAWTAEDAPDYKDPDAFSKTWAFASEKERKLLSNRQGRTCHVVKWTLNSAVKALK